MGDAVETEFWEGLVFYVMGLMRGKGKHTNSVDGLVDHYLAELELLFSFGMTVADVLGDHCHFIAALEAFPASGAVGLRLVVVILIQSGYTTRLADTPVALGARLVGLTPKPERLQEEQNGYADDCDEQ